MLACQDAIVGRSEEDILDIQLMASGFTIDVAERGFSAFSLAARCCRAAGFRKERLNKMTLANQVLDAYERDATRNDVHAVVPGLSWENHEEDCLEIFAGLLSVEVLQARLRQQDTTMVDSTNQDDHLAEPRGWNSRS